jgi:hypothetical protein
VAGHAKIRFELLLAELQRPSTQFSKANAAITDLTEEHNDRMIPALMEPLVVGQAFGKRSGIWKGE